MGATALIRPARASDLEALADLLSALFSIEPDFPIDRPRQIAGLRLLLQHPERAALFVAEIEGAVVGMVSVQTTISTAEGGEAGLLEDLIVLPGHRGLGLGQGLLAAVDGWCRGRGIGRLQLLADCENLSALEYYARLGWAETRMICRRKRV